MTHYILWKNTPLGLLEATLRTQYETLTGEKIQDTPQVSIDGQWKVVGTSRIDTAKIASITQAASDDLVTFKNQGYAAPTDTLDMYFKIQQSFPEGF